MDEPIRNLLAWEIERARGLYRRAEPGIDLLHPTSRDCLRTALVLYAAILDEIEDNDYDVFSQPGEGRPRPTRRGRPHRPASCGARAPSHTHVASVSSTMAKPNSRSSTGANTRRHPMIAPGS